ncbi:hypothetical protein J5J86_01465 [Aquabacter sp. L1I39]|uniref:hypothetical protein n=1 Tax=Aquabacter sp. L1I39 TaxID=2820278 RepID=UPI001ADA348E|nr:hypothetical protein [Aquabacter sp. L1I39]QTL04063.1 hypothetical protein J5J86_01465 [Aquabacter sp. L1I39]
MLFKMNCMIEGLIRFRFEDKIPISVCIDSNNRIELHRSSKGNEVRVDLVSHCSPPSRVADTLRALREDRLLLDQPLQKGVPCDGIQGTIVDEFGKVKEGWAIPFDLLPSGAKPWLDTFRKRARETLKTHIRTLRWRQSAALGHQPFRFGSLDWSEDGNIWSPVPRKIDASFLTVAPFEVDEVSLKEAATLVASNYVEPIAHELLCEARVLIDSAPRSALLITFAALEAGLKKHLSFLLPGGEALIDRLPSPPVTAILKDVIPQLHASRGIDPSYFPLPTEMERLLLKWVTQRNQVAHGVKRSVDFDTLKEFVDLVSDILYAFDACPGHGWAHGHIKLLKSREKVVS